MAVALPPIKNTKTGARTVPAYSADVGSAKPKTHLIFSKSEQFLQRKREELHMLQYDLTKAEVALYRNSYMHSLCLDLLKDGYHLSFKEIFNLMRRQLQEREAAGPESVLWTKILLQDEHTKLYTLKLELSYAETAHRKGDFQSEYEARYKLAHYFQHTQDKWLADHFFKTCLDIALFIASDDGLLCAQGHCNYGLAVEENNENLMAVEHFEAYYQLSKDHQDWLKEDVVRGQLTFFTDACIHLCRIYTCISKQLQEQHQEPERALEFLIKAYNVARQSADDRLEREAAYRLGVAYESSGDVNTALTYLNSVYEICKAAADSEGLVRVCDAIARAYARQGSKQKSIQYLQEFVRTAENNGMDAELSKACHNLGNILNSLGRYVEAVIYFNRAYNISRAMGESKPIQVNRVQSGIAQAHAMLHVYTKIIVDSSQSRDCLQRNIDWKSTRASIFESRQERLSKTQSEQEETPKEEPESTDITSDTDHKSSVIFVEQPEPMIAEEDEQTDQ